MSSRTSAVALALTLAAAVAPVASHAAVTEISASDTAVTFAMPPRTPGIPELVWVVGIEGLPADSLTRAGFDRGFAVAFGENTLRTERIGPDGKTPVPSLPVTNEFRLLYGTAGFGAWQLQATLEPLARTGAATKIPPPMRVTLLIHSPEMVEANARPMPVRTTLTMRAPPGSAVAYARALGGAVARLALEHMSRLLETLPEDERLAIDGFERAAAPAEPAPVRR